jgi:hypothetical protein
VTTTYPWNRFVFPYQTAIDDVGVPLPGALLYFYASGTSTPLDTYNNGNLTPPANTNPVEADASGTFGNIFLQNLEYKVVLKTSAGDEVWTADPVSPFVDDDPTVTSYYDLPVFISGKPTDAEVYPIFNCVRDLTLPASLTGSIFTVATLPTATTTFTLYKNGVSIGTIAFSTAGAATVTFSSNVSFSAGDQFSLTNQNVADTTAADIAFTFVFTVV